jgi:translation initiation factor IF-2
MSDTKESGDKTLSVSGSRTLSLKRNVDSGTVRQNFSHGRSKSVVVEKKKKRLIAGRGAAKPAAETPATETAEQANPVLSEAEKAARDGQVLPTLTEEEREARARALSDHNIAETEAKKVAADEAKVRASAEAIVEEEARKAAEAAAAVEAQVNAKAEQDRVLTEEDAGRKAQAERRAKATVAARASAVGDKPAEDEAGRGKRGRPTPAKTPSTRRNEPRRRSGKLTIGNALNDEERQRSIASMRRAREREKRQARVDDGPAQKVYREVIIPDTITVQELANRMTERAVDVIKVLMKQGTMATMNDVLDADTAQLIAEEFGHQVERVSEADVEEGIEGVEDIVADLHGRAPVVTVMGHVDHGKTSLLDALRATDVVTGEAGGITQHIGAYQVQLESGAKITFLDTPGHAAFTSMRARGAQVTDVVILVVAADDGVMPQTVEAIAHAKAAGVPIIVAINKMDKPDADPSRVKQELLQHEIIVEEMGGEVQTIEVSAQEKTNLDGLEEAIVLQSEILELKANPNRLADGAVVEARLDRGRGPVATVLVQRGTLRVGDILVAGAEWGKVRALINDRGEPTDEAGPAVPVEVLGLNSAPEAGDQFAVVETEARAREITEYRQRKRKDASAAAGQRGGLEQMLSQLKENETSELPLVIKGDVQGSVEAIIGALDNLGTDEVKVQVVFSGVGGISESDVILAEASGIPILGFNVRANAQARDRAKKMGVEIRYYSIIYNLVDDIKAAMEGLLSPILRETFLGNAEILEVFNISKTGKVAGCRITEGNVQRGAKVRLIRDSVVIHEGTLSTLKRFKDEVREVNAGQECGMAFENYQDLKEKDVIECFTVEEVARTL